MTGGRNAELMGRAPKEISRDAASKREAEGVTHRQRQAERTLSELRIFEVLAKYRPVLTGTVPLGLDVHQRPRYRLRSARS